MNRYDELWINYQNLIDSLINTLASINTNEREKLAEAIKAAIEDIETDFGCPPCFTQEIERIKQ